MALVTDQNYTYEVEYTSTGEGELHERRRKCMKNPKHENFFPIKTFTQNHLPIGFQTEKIMKIIRIIADLTVRIRVLYTSMSRPITFPETDQLYASAELRGCSCMRVGTGFISDVKIERSRTTPDGLEYCPCYTCRCSKNPHKIWGQISVTTAAHVVCTPDEIVHTEVDCFYDDDEDNDTKVKILYGDSMRASESPIIKVDFADDFCHFSVITHDIDLCLKLSEYTLDDLWNFDFDIDPSLTSYLTLVVSHPHGCPKCVSCGEWTSYDILTDPDGLEKRRYTYNTPTCPGSSGALVWLLETSHNRWQKIYVHSGSLNNCLNASGAVELFAEHIKGFFECHIS